MRVTCALTWLLAIASSTCSAAQVASAGGTTFTVSVPAGMSGAPLDDSVYFAQARLEALHPAYGGSVAYGDRAEHCWNGDPKLPNAYSRLHYDFQYLPIILQRIAAAAPAGADLRSWRY